MRTDAPEDPLFIKSKKSFGFINSERTLWEWPVNQNDWRFKTVNVFQSADMQIAFAT